MYSALLPGSPLSLNAHDHVLKRLCRFLVFGSSGQVAMADALPWLWATLVDIAKTLCALLRPTGLDTGQLIKYLCLVVLTGV